MNLAERMSYMLEHCIDADVTFAVRNSSRPDIPAETIRAHKYMLVAGSHVFRTLFSDSQSTDETIFIHDVEPKAFKEMLRYLYTDKATIDEGTVLPVLSASMKYNIPLLKEKCYDLISPENACNILECSISFSEADVNEICMKIIEENTDVALKGDSFMRISLRTLDYILDSDRLNMSEIDLFERCLKWAKYKLSCAGIPITKSSLRGQLDLAIYKLRFPIMSTQDFSTVVCACGILQMEEEVQIFRYLSNPDKSMTRDLAFSTKKRGWNSIRQFLFDDRGINVRDSLIRSAHGNLPLTQTLSLSADENLRVTSLHIRNPSEVLHYDIAIAIPQSGWTSISYDRETKDNSVELFRLTGHGLKLEKNKEIEMKFTLNLNDASSSGDCTNLGNLEEIYARRVTNTSNLRGARQLRQMQVLRDSNIRFSFISTSQYNLTCNSANSILVKFQSSVFRTGVRCVKTPASHLRQHRVAVNQDRIQLDPLILCGVNAVSQ